MKIVFWWNIPCDGMMGVFKSFYFDISQESILITGELSDSRKAMGWTEKKSITPNHIIINNDGWETDGPKLLLKYRDYLHVFNGIGYPNRIANINKLAIREGIAYCNMSESYCNLESGLKKYIKNIYLKLILRLRVYSYAKNSLGIFCLSGNNPSHYKHFKNLGFKKEYIYPFGYYTSEKEFLNNNKSDDSKIYFLCPGLLERYKGVDILIKAFHLVKDRGYNNFKCYITGKGSQEVNLKDLTTRLGLSNNIIFKGVMPAEEYSILLSQIDILVAPGRIEPWGIRINEAIQRGNAVIVSDKLGASQLIQESGGGCAFPSGNIKELANSICKYLANSRELDDAKKKNIEYKINISCENKAAFLADLLRNILLNK